MPKRNHTKIRIQQTMGIKKCPNQGMTTKRAKTCRVVYKSAVYTTQVTEQRAQGRADQRGKGQGTRGATTGSQAEEKGKKRGGEQRRGG